MKYNEKLDKEIQWHPPYVAAMNLELSNGTNNVKLEPEHTLNTGTLKIDLRAECDGSKFTGNEIGELFKQYNIMEYKNPNDALDIDVFMKAQGYACLFKAYGDKTKHRWLCALSGKLEEQDLKELIASVPGFRMQSSLTIL